MLDPTAAAVIAAAFDYYGVPVTVDVETGRVSTDQAGLTDIGDAHRFTSELRHSVELIGAEATVARLPELLNDEHILRGRLEELGFDLSGPGLIIPERLVLRALVDLDLYARVRNLDDAGDPVEELRFVMDAGETGNYSQLGEHVAGVAELLAATRSI
jgi:hypothetical protein